MKKILYFFVICLYALGFIGGLGWTLYNRAFLIAFGVFTLGVMAFPTLKTLFHKLID